MGWSLSDKQLEMTLRKPNTNLMQLMVINIRRETLQGNVVPIQGKGGED